MSDTSRLVEQAREWLATDMPEPIGSQLLAGLADEVERQADEHNDECAVLGQTIMDAHAERDALQAERDRLADGIREAIKVCDAKGYSHLSWYLGMVLLDVAGDDRKDG